MTEKASKILLFIEMLVICLPLSMLYFFAVMPSQLYFYPQFGEIYSLLMLLIISGSLISAWYLAASFFIGGRGKLILISNFWWALPSVCAVLSVFSLLRLIWVDVLVPSTINTFAWGLPLLLPFFHLLAEILFRKK